MKPLDFKLNLDRPEVQRFFHYLKIRNAVWRQRMDKQPINYEGDNILATYKFMNIWRELDTFSQWERNRIQGKVLSYAVWVILIGRMVLNPITAEFLEQADDNITAEQLCDFLKSNFTCPEEAVGDAIERWGLQNWGTLAGGLVRYRRRLNASKLDMLCTAIEYKTRTPNQLMELIHKLFNISIFDAYEIVTSFTYLGRKEITEDNIYHMGHGARPALAMLLGHQVPTEYEYLALSSLAREAKWHLEQGAIDDWEWIPQSMQGNVMASEPHKWTLRTMEDALCEFRKYENIYRGGPGRRLYKGTNQ
jgi:hypothetical protein